MGAAYYAVLEKQIDGLDTMIDRKLLLQHMDSLDSLARQLGVRPLSEFISMDADALADDAEGINVPALQQFSAEDGLATIRAVGHV
jgi:hypothetical protein